MTISNAIASLKLLTFEYDGFPRVVEPHTYGLDAKGHRALRAYQVRGGSDSGEFVGWKLFHERDMSGIRVLSESFVGPRPKYKRGDKAFRTIIAEL